MKRIGYALLMILAILLWIQGADSKAMTLEEARSLSRQSQDLQAKKLWDDAVDLLTHGLQDCGNQNQGKSCRATLYFSLGYLFQQRSEMESENKRNYLEKAAGFYRQALTEQPLNTQIMNNLAMVLKGLGRWQQAAELFKQLTNMEEDKRDLYLVALGDLYRENNRLMDALKAYQQSSELNPSDETAYRKTLSLYYLLPDKAMGDLLNLSRHLMEINFLQLAKDGFEQVINRSFKTDISLAEAALLDWTELMAANDLISDEAFQLLPDLMQWDSQAAKELHILVTNPLAAGNNLNWWTKDYIRRHIIASVLKTVANHFLVKGEIKDAEEMYQMALNVAPGFDDYNRDDLKDKTVISMEIAVALASLYHRHPELDPEGDQFRRLERELFNEKALHYARKDLMAIQRSHTVLGLIYYEKDRWTSEWGVDNAIFQLYHALAIAKERVKLDPKNYQPLPYLQSLLAKGYIKVNEPRRACENFIDAAMGYLDLDELKEASLMIESADYLSHTVSPDARPGLEQVKKILILRQGIQKLQFKDFNSNSSEYYGKDKVNRWFFDSRDLRLDPSFVNRQRFKALADTGSSALQLGKPIEALRLHSQALEVIKMESSLTSMEDIVRLNQIKNTVHNYIHMPLSEQVIGTGNYLEADINYNGGKIWTLPLSPEQQSLQVGIGQDLLLAGKIAVAFSKEPILSTMAVKLNIKDRGVTILSGKSSNSTINKVSAKIKTIEGVRHIRIE